MEKSPFHLQAKLDQLYANQPRQLPFRASSVVAFVAWQQSLRAKVAEVLGIAGRNLPGNPHAELLHAVDRGQYIEEKYSLEVGEDTQAPVYVLVPRTPPPYKAVLAFHGHSPSVQPLLGNYAADDPSAAERLARKESYARTLAEEGFLVVAIEQRGMGERIADQYGINRQPNSCRQISLDYLLEGRTMIGERCWDAMVALNYLQSRDDLVPGAVGCVGCSGGGTTALWLSALDERIAASVVEAYFSSFKHSILGVPHCECNYVPHILKYAEMGDLAALIAPRAFLVAAGENDPIFPVEGARQQFETVSKAYTLLGVPERCSLAVHSGVHEYRHEYTQEWFTQWL